MLARTDLPPSADSNQVDESALLTHSLHPSDTTETDLLSAFTSRCAMDRHVAAFLQKSH